MHRRFRLLFLVLALPAASFAWGQAAIIKCVDREGHVTLTDQPCASDEQAKPLESEAREAELDLAGEVRQVEGAAVSKQSAPPRALSGDVTTVRAARAQSELKDANRKARTTVAGAEVTGDGASNSIEDVVPAKAQIVPPAQFAPY